jgi:molybdate transport system ATP-binding protein
MAEKFLELQNVGVKIGNEQVLKNINLCINKNEQWLITGSSGSGKTVLAHCLTGKHFYSGQIDFYFPKKNIVLVEQQHRFKNLSNTNDLYYQQRFNSSDSENTITVDEELKENALTENFLENECLDILHVRELLKKPLIQLSNGENKRTQLAIALLEQPEFLILDNPFTGLDVEGRKILHQIIQSISQKGVHILLISTNQEIPENITHVACLEKGEIIFACKKEEFHLPNKIRSISKLDSNLLKQLKQLNEAAFDFAIKMVNVNVQYDDKKILAQINWTVRNAERWNLSGPNGAGKSTLLSLITADNPQAYANEIYLFDKRRGSGESIWDIKKKIGFVSPELHLYFDFSATCYEVIASGLFDTIGLFRQVNDTQKGKISLWLHLLELEKLQSKRLAQLSLGEQRRALLARALIKNPPLLILDEPCQGLDDEQTDYFKNLIDQICESFRTTLVYVSHYKHQIPDCVDHFLHLENGRIL